MRRRAYRVEGLEAWKCEQRVAEFVDGGGEGGGGERGDEGLHEVVGQLAAARRVDGEPERVLCAR